MSAAVARWALASVAVAAVALSGCNRLRPEPGAPGVFARASDSAGDLIVIDRVDAEGDPTPTRGVRSIAFPVRVESADRMFPGAAVLFADATVPVLAPEGLSRDQAERFAESYRSTPDGYFARIGYGGYDVVVNGTRAYATPPPEADPITARQMTDWKVSESETGLSVTFSRYGADYSLDFVCRGAGDEEGATCVGEDAAAEVARSLVPVGGGGQ